MHGLVSRDQGLTTSRVLPLGARAVCYYSQSCCFHKKNDFYRYYTNTSCYKKNIGGANFAKFGKIDISLIIA